MTEAEWHAMRIKRCRYCRRQVIWFHKDGTNIPVDADTVQPEDVEFEHGRHTIHHETCRTDRGPRP